MKRRDFLYLSTLFLSSKLLGETKTTPWEIILATLEHMFPKQYFSYHKSFLDFKSFLTLPINQKYLEKGDYELLLEGAKKIYSIAPNFTKLPPYKKEKILRKLENTNKGYQWLNTLQTNALEAMFSDPIYLGNKNQFAFKVFSHNPGIPRPTKRYVYGI